MAQIGSLAANFHEGARSEYLAEYALTSLGMASMIPRQEDVGIDMQCALGERIGGRLVIDRYYLVQIKSAREFDAYEGRGAVQWLCEHRHPLFYVVVNKKDTRIEIYQTCELVSLYALDSVTRVVLKPGDKPSTFDSIVPAEEVTLNLGPPILSFNIKVTSDDAWREKAKEVLRSWIEIDQANIDSKRQGLGLNLFPLSYETNKTVAPGKISGNFKLQPKSKKDSPWIPLSKHVSVLLHRAAADRNIARFYALASFINDVLIPETKGSGDAYWMAGLVFAHNAAAEQLGIPVHMVVRFPDGQRVAPKVTIKR